MTSRVRSEEVEMRGKKVRRGGDKSMGAEDGTGGGEMRADRRREVEGRVKAVEGGHRKRGPSGGLRGEE